MTVAQLDDGFALDLARADGHRRTPALRRTRAAIAAAQARHARSGIDPARSVRTRDRFADRARRSRRRPLSGPGQARRRRRRRIPQHRIRERRQAVRAGRAVASGVALFGRLRRHGAAAFARRRSLGTREETRRAESARRRRRTARAVCAARGAARHRVQVRPRDVRAVRHRVPVRGNAGSAARHRSGDRRSGHGQVDGSRGLRRRRLRQDRSRAARRLRRRDGGQAGRVAGADHAARATALPELPRPFRRLADPRRSAVALQDRRRKSPPSSTSFAKARSTSSSARIACCRPT